MTSFKRVFGAISLVSLLLTGCSATAPNAEDKNIVIGAIGPLTGDASGYGIPFQRAVTMAVEKINEEWAADGKTLTVKWEDGACNGKDASTATQKLVDVDGVKVILGGFCSSETLAAAAITEPKQVLLFSPASSSPDVSTAGDYVFRNWPSDAFQGQVLAETANKQTFKKVAMISEKQDYTAGISKVFTAKFQEMGGTVVEETYLPADTDFKTQLTKLKAEKADVIFVNPQTDIKGDAILKQMKEMGIKGPFILNDVAGTNANILSTYKDYLEGSYTANVGVDETKPEVSAFAAAYKAKYKEDIAFQSYTLAAYDAAMIIANGLKEKGNDATALKDYLNAFPGYTGLLGAYSFDENGDPKTGHSVFKIEGGKNVMVK